MAGQRTLWSPGQSCIDTHRRVTGRQVDRYDLLLLTGRNPARVAAAVAGATATRPRSPRIEGRHLESPNPDAVARLAAEIGGSTSCLQRGRAHHAERFPRRAGRRVTPFERWHARDASSFRPIMRPRGRLIVVASFPGTLGISTSACTPFFDDVPRSIRRGGRGRMAGGDPRRAPPAGSRLAEWVNVPSKWAQVPAVRAAARRAGRDLADGTRVALSASGGGGGGGWGGGGGGGGGLGVTATSRPWFDDFQPGSPPATGLAVAVLDFVLPNRFDPATYVRSCAGAVACCLWQREANDCSVSVTFNFRSARATLVAI